MIGEKLKELRIKHKYTIAQVCKMLDLKENTYPKYERNERDVSTDMIKKFADFYGVSTDYLLGRSTDIPPLDQLASQFNMQALEREIVDGYLSLPEEMREGLMEFLERAVQKVQAQSNAEVAGTTEGKTVFKIASSKDNHRGEVKTLTPEEVKRLDNATDVTTEDSDL